MLNTNQLNELQDVARQALQCEITTGIPAELTISQWALESGWGEHQPGNNCFGIKYYEGAPDKQLLVTTEFFTLMELERWLKAEQGRMATALTSEVDEKGRRKYKCEDWFVSYPTLAGCFEDRADRVLLRGSFANYLGTYKVNNNLTSYIANVATAYATDPDYCKKVMTIMSMPEVVAAIRSARVAYSKGEM